MEKERLVFRNAAEIGSFIDENPQNIPLLVQKYGLPARKINRRWKAFVPDIRPWLEKYISGEFK